MKTNSDQPVASAEANDSRTASDEAVVCKELLGVTRQLYRIPDDSEVQSVFEDSVKACDGTVVWLCPTLAHAEFKSADDYMVFELIRRGVRAPNAELTDAGPVTPASRETQSRHSVQ